MSSTNMFIPSELQSMASSFFSAYASLAASTMLVRSVTNDLIPSPFRSYFESAVRYLFSSRAPQFITIVVDEYGGYTRNQVYESVEIYLRSRISSSTERFKVNKTPRQTKINVAIDREFEVTDRFQNFEVKWTFVIADQQNRVHNYYELSVEKKFKGQVLDDYLPFVLAKSQELKEKNKFVKLYTRDITSSAEDDEDDYGHGYGRSSGRWGSINLEHPFTFDTLAMDPDMKKAIIDDLERFVRRRDYYKKVGKAWKRGYLLYGPPGTGKSSIIAAMANYLRFDIYDLELTSMYSNSDLRRVLLSTTNRSIIVIEDIDCSAQTKNRKSDDYEYNSYSRLTLSGLLNFIDGLWSSCADERIIIFTTNHKDRLDPALLRPGRMDMHIYMSYCTHHGFRVLASNYLGVKGDHRLFGEIEKVIGKVQVTPAQLAEEMMKSEDVDIALQGVLDFLNHKEMQLLACNKAKDIDTIISEEPTSGGRAPTAHGRGRGGGGGGRGRGGGGGGGGGRGRGGGGRRRRGR